MTNSLDYLAATARKGLKDVGRGAVVIWEPEGQEGFVSFEGSYMPESAPALSRIGPDGKQLLKSYDLSTQFLVVFITGHTDVVPVLGNLPGPGH